MLEDLKDRLKQLVSEAKALARTRQQEHEEAEANVAARMEDAKARALAIDWT